MKIEIRKPQKMDAKSIFNLVKSTKVLDINSEYLYLLQSTHFDDTCAVATDGDTIVGFASGYIEPKDKSNLFIWQVGVNENYRGQGIAKKLIEFILEHNSNKEIEYIHTTISPSNKSSENLFLKLSKELGANITLEKMFDVNDFNHAHEDEVLYKIGPLHKEKK